MLALVTKEARGLKAIWWGLCTLLILAVILASLMGSIPVGLEEVVDSLLWRETMPGKILWNMRYPRILLTVLSGINLGLSGLLIQAVLKNPLTDSNILGVNAGASLMAVIFLVLLPEQAAFLPLASILGGLLTFALVMRLSWDRYASSLRMIITGITVRALVTGFQDLVITLNSDKLQGLVMWLAGDLGGKTWQDIASLAAYSLPAYFLAYGLHDKMDLLQLDDSLIFSLGVSSRKYRLIIASLGVYLSSITVSFIGLVGFIGLIIPHIARILAGGSHRKLVLFSLVLGPLLMVAADIFARTVAAPLELPIGTTMSLLGGPCFLYLIYRYSQRRFM